MKLFYTIEQFQLVVTTWCRCLINGHISLFSGADWTTWLEPETSYTADEASVCRNVKIYGAVSMVVVVIRNLIVIMFVFLTITKVTTGNTGP